VAAKAQEANDLRVQNQQLREENTRLTDLTRMLLSSQAFSGFLQELSQSGVPPPTVPKAALQQKPVQAQAQPQPMQKDVAANANVAQMQHQQPQIGMALIPETTMDYSALQPSNGWMNSLATNDFQVYAVTEVPLPSILDLEVLSGKPSSSKETRGSKEIPRIPELPSQAASNTQTESPAEDESVSLDRNTFALYYDATASTTQQADTNLSDSTKLRVTVSESVIPSLEQLCSDLDEACERLAAFVPHTA
jgi:bZIP-type transcription factor MBZ1